MAQPEISSRQVRALLLVLVLGPVVAAILLIKFLAEFADAQHQDAVQQLGAVYQQSLLTANAAFQRQLRAGTAPDAGLPLAKRAFEFLDEFFGGAVSLRVTDQITGTRHETTGDPGEKVASTRLQFNGQSIVIDLMMKPENAGFAGLAVGSQLYVWIAVFAVGINLIIAAVAARVVNRQLRMHELRSSTLSTVAHELRTPLASMRLLLETLVAKRVRDQNQADEYIQLAFRENERLSRLVERFLTFSRVGRKALILNKAETTPARVVHRAIEAAGLARDTAFLDVQVPETFPSFTADEDALVMALMNLIENAIKYSGDNKKITIRAALLEGTLTFSVEDNGIGIPKSQLGAIFRDFHQVDQRLSRTAEGCGLGLSIVKSLIEAHGGRVRVESIPGKGSTFTIHLPLT